MSLSEYRTRQWEVYSRFHQSRLNLLIHILCVPLFIYGFLLFLKGLVLLNPIWLGISAVTMGIAFAAQGIGHARESAPTEPFKGPADALIRILLEQFYTFPKFVLSGGWYRAFSKGSG